MPAISEQSLGDLKVVEFSWYAAGPQVTKYLALHGATVVHVESETRVDTMRTTPPFARNQPGINRSAMFATMNPNKLGLSLNLKHPKGLQVATKLAQWSDVVVENYTPGTIASLGLGYDRLSSIKPGLIMLSSSNLGQTGPLATAKGFGVHLAGYSGFTYLNGYPGRSPALMVGLVTDMISARFAICAVLAALEYRNRSGEGQYIDISQMESSVQFLAPLLLDYLRNGAIVERSGNQVPDAVPHNVYPCAGDDRWCAISAYSDEQWDALREAIGAVIPESEFNSLSKRKEHEGTLDKLVAGWTVSQTREEITDTLQAKGVPASVVKDTKDVFEDPQLGHRGHFVQLEHPEIGVHSYQNVGFRLSGTPAEFCLPGPCLGEHNEYVCTKLLGLSDQEFVELLDSGALR